MADPTGEPIQVADPTMVTQITTKKIHNSSSSSSSSSDSDGDDKHSHASVIKSNIHRLFGREKPVHKVLGGGRHADIILWRNRKMSATIFCGVTTIWFMFEMLEYHFITLVCHILIFALSILFMWSNASAFFNKSAPQVPEIQLPDKCVLEVFSVIRTEMNHALATLRDITTGRDLRKFLGADMAHYQPHMERKKKEMGVTKNALRQPTSVGSWFNFLTLIYLIFVLLFSLPALYEKYEDQVDPIAEKALMELKKHYTVFDKNVLSKIPSGAMKDKKRR